jgi:polysaccharide biosynthesis/export protein
MSVSLTIFVTVSALFGVFGTSEQGRSVPAVAGPAPKVDRQAPSSGADPINPVAASYVIGQQDLLNITVFDEPELSGQSYRVDSDGMITFWLLGRVSAGGLTLRQFQDRLREQLANGYIKNPQVRVEIEQYKSQSINVFGEVRQPGRISMMGTKTLLEALAEAGSPTSQASTEITITHPRRPKATVPTGDLLPEGDKTVLRARLSAAAAARARHVSDPTAQMRRLHCALQTIVQGQARQDVPDVPEAPERVTE